MSSDESQMTFWDHFDALRRTLWHSVLAVLVLSVAAFVFKDFIFDKIVLAPLSGDFFMYGIFHAPENLNIVNLEITGQFMTHIRVALMVGLIISIPYIIWELWRFIAPALYPSEHKSVSRLFLLASGFFYLGVAVGYFILMPVCMSFFQAYVVSDIVTNNFSLQSYMSMFTSMVVLLGLVFEFPLLLMMLTKIGILSVNTLKKGRRYAFVAILIISAFITPADLGSMIIVALPLYGLYELSILMCRNNPTESSLLD